MSLPFPGDSSLDDEHEEELAPARPPAPPKEGREHQQQHAGPFISTTTQPLPVDVTPRQNRSSSVASSSVLNRGRPKSKASSFFGAPEGGGDRSQSMPSSEFGGTGTGRGGDAESDYDGGGHRSRAGSFFGVGASPGPEHGFDSPAHEEAGSPSGARAGERGDEHEHEHSGGGGGGGKRSSFYGLDANLPRTPPPADDRQPVQPPSGLPSGSRTLYQANGGDSGSGSYSSHEVRGAQPANVARYHNSAPYAASKAASLYGINASGDAYALPPAAPLLDQSHLQPGTLASLLSHDKTLELYRTNAKKTNDPDVQFEFCTFVMEVVGEMEESQAQAVAALGGDGQSDPVAKSKQQALVAESVALLSKLAHRGHVKSQYFLADCYTQGIGTVKGKRDYDKAFPLFVLAGKHGHADACFRAAQCCENGWGCKRDQTKSVSLYRRAAVLSHPGAMHRLGLAEINGELGLSKRPREGVKWLKRAAELADAVDPPQPQSLHELAMLSEKGIDNVIFKDEEYAAELLARASELQYAPSAYKLGECYEYGKMGCPQDSALSIHYYNIAAQQDHREACFALTAWYLVGSPGVLPQSDTEAYLWARKAADMGLAKAEYAVGYFTEVGIGTHKDDREALEWFRKAADQGDKRAMDRLRMAAASAQQARNGPPPPSKSRAPLPPPPSSYKPPPQTTATKRMQKKQREQPPRPSSAQGKHGQTLGGAPYSSYDVENGRPEIQRQRSHSQPTPIEPRTVYAPLNLSSGAPESSYSQHPRDGPTGGAYGEGGRGIPLGETFKPIHPGQARMPTRQQRGASPGPEARGQDEGDAHRERVLQKGKRGPEDKDCLIM